MGDFEIYKFIDVLEFDTSNRNQKFLITYSERYFEVGYDLALFITSLKSTTSLEEAAVEYSKASGSTYYEKDVSELITKHIDPIISSVLSKPRQPLLAKFKLIPDKDVEKATQLFKFLFSPPVAISVLAIIIALEILYFTSIDLKFNIHNVNLPIILSVFFLYVCSSLFHEMGHATACRYYNASQKGIGFGLYLNLPVFYTDVSTIWKLPRKQRFVVNIAGCYFQLIFLVPFIIIGLATGNPIINYFIFTVNLNFLITLNPFFKFDGYWITSDLLGVPNLRRRTNEFFLYIWRRIKGNNTQEKPFLLQMKGGAKIAMLFYAIVVNIFFAYYFFYLIPKFVYHFLQEFPPQFTMLIQQLAVGETPNFLSVNVVFTQLLFASFLLYFIYRIIKKMVSKK